MVVPCLAVCDTEKMAVMEVSVVFAWVISIPGLSVERLLPSRLFPVIVTVLMEPALTKSGFIEAIWGRSCTLVLFAIEMRLPTSS